MQITQGSLVIVGANTPDMQVFFDGEIVEGVQDLKIDWDKNAPKVTLTLTETAKVTLMKANGINVRRQA